MYRILLIDDNRDDLNQSQRALKATLDCVLVMAITTTEAINACESGEFDIILIDVNMPDISGPRLKALLEQQQSMRSACVMYLTGTPTDHRLHQHVAGNVGAVLIKPLDQARIEEMLFHLEVWADGLEDC